MLLCQDFRRRHQRNLVSVFHGDNGGFEGHDRLARAHIALQQATHGKRFFHIGSDLFQHPLLRPRGMERKNFFYRGAHAIIQPERDAGLCLLLAAFQLESELDEKQFFENQADVRRSAGRLQVLQTFAGVGPVNSSTTLREAKSSSDDAAPRPGWDRANPGIRFSSAVRMMRRNQRESAFPDRRTRRSERCGQFRASPPLSVRLTSARSIVCRLADDLELRLHQLQFAAR